MKNLLCQLDKTIDKIGDWILIIAGTSICSIIITNAVMRYVLHIDLFGSEEIVMFIAFWLYFIGSASAARENTHINANMMSLFTDNKKMLEFFNLIKCVVSLAICALITYWCYNYVAWSFELGARSNIFKTPNVVAQFPILLSFFLWCIYLIRDIVISINTLKTQR